MNGGHGRLMALAQICLQGNIKCSRRDPIFEILSFLTSYDHLKIFLKDLQSEDALANFYQLSGRIDQYRPACLSISKHALLVKLNSNVSKLG